MTTRYLQGLSSAIALGLCLTALSAAPSLAQKAAAPAKQAGYASEADAKSKCAGDTVVWVNPKSKVYHYAGSADYGKTKKGDYECEKQASAGGNRAAKGEKKN